MSLVARVAAVAWIAAAAAPLGCSAPAITLEEGRFKAAGPGGLTVRVAGSSDPLFGEASFVDGMTVFVPRFPLRPGLTYRATFERPHQETLERTFEIASPPPSSPTFVRAVFPSADLLPENLLRFYLHFSAPMSRGEAYRRVHLLGPDGKPVELPFLEIGEELWDRGGSRLTLLFDPGRIKRGLKPREDSGPALEEGKSYTLVIDAEWRDAEGRPLKAGHRKSFKVGPADDKQPDPKAWVLEAPRAGTRDPLVVRFDEPLDEGMLHRSLGVTGVEGRIEIDSGERRWKYLPEAAWPPGLYSLMIDTALEDAAGNSIARPFEVDVFQPGERVPKARTMRLEFRVN